MKKNHASLALSLTSLLAACGANDAPALYQVDYDDVAIAVGVLVSNPWGSDALSFFDCMIAAAGPSDPVDEPDTFEPSDEPLKIAYRGDLTSVYYGICRDADGVDLYVCGDDAASMDIESTWFGNLDAQRYAVEVNRTATWRITGLLGDVAELEGSSTFDTETHLDAIHWGTTRDLVLTYEAEYQAVRMDTETFKILSGTIRYDIDGVRIAHLADGDRQVDIAMDVIATFPGDSTVELVVAGEHRYTVAMYTGVITTEDGTIIDVLAPW